VITAATSPQAAAPPARTALRSRTSPERRTAAKSRDLLAALHLPGSEPATGARATGVGRPPIALEPHPVITTSPGMLREGALELRKPYSRGRPCSGRWRGTCQKARTNSGPLSPVLPPAIVAMGVAFPLAPEA
jgi:hypothetical protein